MLGARFESSTSFTLRDRHRGSILLGAKLLVGEMITRVLHRHKHANDLIDTPGCKKLSGTLRVIKVKFGLKLEGV
jgi:hypothetical protein